MGEVRQAYVLHCLEGHLAGGSDRTVSASRRSNPGSEQSRRKHAFTKCSPWLLAHPQANSLDSAKGLWLIVCPVSHRPRTNEPFSPKQKGPLRVLASDSGPTQKVGAFLSSSCSLPLTSLSSYFLHLSRHTAAAYDHVHSFLSYSQVPTPTLLTWHDLRQQLGKPYKCYHLPAPCTSWSSPRALGRQTWGTAVQPSNR